MNRHPMETLKDMDSKLLAQVKSGSEFAFAEGKISKKHKLLIAMAVDATIRAGAGVTSLARQALDEGATREEILETLRIVHYIGGVSCTYAAIPALQDLI